MVVFVMLALGVMGSIWNSQRQFKKLFRSLAASMQGGLSSLNSLPTVYLNRNGVDFVAMGRILKGKSTLTVSAVWPDPTFRAKLFPESLPDEMKTFIGMQDIKVGNPKFDARFVVQSNDEHRLLEILQPEAQAAIISLGQDVVLNINGARIQLERQVQLTDRNGVNATIQRFMDAYFILRGSALDDSPSLQFKAVSLFSAQAVCMVCGESIADGRVQCRRCHTPHHQECWEYLGKCSTYGCGETKYQPGGKTSRLRIG
jgi:hypothetical protein